MSEKRKKLEPLLSGESYFANFIHNLEALLQAEPLFSYIRSVVSFGNVASYAVHSS
ncbi:hypothetical protein LACR_0768 [Lactococcus cremoris subsp. cremoris SK11]|uniref:Uncharacterized protein n=3 Tax=Lactococcus lactis subsp. cremoris TaxID=1359 RepID=A0A896T8M8_LACLC|nr:hypothetical protein LACR_0768 [Lactococcus cremoris subsp. cremoris SK11]AEU41024.1 hypothetical protein llh_9240 [Lactococcus cremoris subsp. cremoris A76]EQC94270.1 hypothetical protein LLT3_08120 [Lactococcus cremoris subsp. cremoris TIFN3]KKW70795.1 hypothetical protein VN93_2065 [Lactococcus cremoris]